MERLTGITGCMFSGKTAELLRLVDRAERAGQSVQVFKPYVDDRWDIGPIVRSHSKGQHEATIVQSSFEIITALKEGTNVVAIDEAQFFDEAIVDVVEELLERDIQVVVAGLPLNFKGEEFGQMPKLLARSDSLRSMPAICQYINDNGLVCGKDATRTQRVINGRPANYDDPVILIGAEESYEARCVNHHEVPGKPRKFRK